MERALSTHLFVNKKLTPAVLQQVEEAGLSAVEIFCARQHFDYADPAHIRQLAAWFGDHALELRSLHAPMYSDFEWGHSGSRAVVNLAELEPIRRQESLDQVKRALDVAGHIPFRYIVLHVGVRGESYDPQKFDAALASLETLLAFARPRGVQLLLENTRNELSTPPRLREFIDSSGLKDLRICFDIGHAHLCGGVEAEFDLLRDLVVSCHVHDNHGQDDDHLFPFQGTIDWEEAMRALTSAGGEFPLQLELRDYGEFPRPLEKALEIFARLEELVPAPQL
jgi:sugar phosphate isomerase/epimerase